MNGFFQQGTIEHLVNTASHVYKMSYLQRLFFVTKRNVV